MQQDPIMPQQNTWVWIIVAAAVVVIAILGWVFFMPGKDAAPALEGTVPPAPVEEQAVEPAPPVIVVEDSPRADPAWAARVAEIADNGKTSAAAADTIREELIDLLRALDRDRGILDAGGGASAYELFSASAIDLAKRPPVASGEVESYKSILSNLTHLARTFGKKKTRALVRALNARGDDLEPLAAASFRWLITRQAHGEKNERVLSTKVLYDYATFLLNTMGGQSYLQRRLPRQEALAVFYSLLIVDRARDQKISNHGTELGPHFARCRQLLETQDLIYRDQYLAILDKLEARW